MSDRLHIVEVGLRDGLQNEPAHVSTADKLRLYDALRAAGVRELELTSFVSPRAIPQLADAEDLAIAVGERSGIGRRSALIVNRRGYERARVAAAHGGIDAVAIVVVLTEELCRRNNRTTVAEGLAAAEALVRDAHKDGVHVRAYLAPAWVCPYAGAVPPATAIAAAERLAAAGVDELAIADTIGHANPRDVGALFETLGVCVPGVTLAAHLHDTCALGLANAAAAIAAGVRTIDAAIGGLGGCPFAPGAAGNLATEDLVLLADKLGLETGIELGPLWDAVALAGQLVGRPIGGRTAGWWHSVRAARAA